MMKSTKFNQSSLIYRACESTAVIIDLSVSCPI